MGILFSNRCELAIQTMLYLSSEGEEKLIAVQEIAERMDIPRQFAAKVMQELVAAKLAISQKGKNGGFTLAKPAREITIIEIIKAIDGSDIFSKCVLGFPGCSLNEPCPIHIEWGKIRLDLKTTFTKYSLNDLKDMTKSKLLDIFQKKLLRDPQLQNETIE